MFKHQRYNIENTTAMKIEQVIKQNKPFPNVHERALVNLLYTTNWLRDRMSHFLKPFGITIQQYNVLRILGGAKQPISTSTIRERLLDKMSDTSRMVNRLHQKGLVNRTACAKDKRLVDVSLSEKGTQLLASVAQHNDRLGNLLSGLDQSEVLLLNDILDKIRG
ncbi:MAG: MarR family winged helix-turn-helix transcriptional regulator [Chitinophagales bacterium]